MSCISLSQPRHSYAPSEGIGHVHLSAPLLLQASRLMEAGVDVRDINDENIRPFEPQSENIGFNIVGAPYLPLVRNRIRNFHGDVRAVLGGQTVSGLVVEDEHTGEMIDDSRLRMLFGDDVVNGNRDKELCLLLGIHQEELSLTTQTSLVPAYERISDEDMRLYLNHEMSFYLSQGCKNGCIFCGVKQRMRRNPLTRKVERGGEVYRDMDIVKKDLTYLVERAKQINIPEIRIYLSNLDLFQTPHKLLEFAQLVQAIKRETPEVRLGMRALSCVDSFVIADENRDQLGCGKRAIEEMVKAGLHTVGFGVDGGTYEVRKRQKKAFNTEEDCIGAQRIAREEYGITPEILMVFGHPQETEESLRSAYTFTRDMVDRFGAVPRPHVDKDLVPGSDYWWREANRERVRFLLGHPDYLQALDFTALPSSISHPDPDLRRLVRKWYLKIIQIPENVTQPILPMDPELSEEENRRNMEENERKYDI